MYALFTRPKWHLRSAAINSYHPRHAGHTKRILLSSLQWSYELIRSQNEHAREHIAADRLENNVPDSGAKRAKLNMWEAKITCRVVKATFSNQRNLIIWSDQKRRESSKLFFSQWIRFILLSPKSLYKKLLSRNKRHRVKQTSTVFYTKPMPVE